MQETEWCSSYSYLKNKRKFAFDLRRWDGKHTFSFQFADYHRRDCCDRGVGWQSGSRFVVKLRYIVKASTRNSRRRENAIKPLCEAIATIMYRERQIARQERERRYATWTRKFSGLERQRKFESPEYLISKVKDSFFLFHLEMHYLRLPRKNVYRFSCRTRRQLRDSISSKHVALNFCKQISSIVYRSSRKIFTENSFASNSECKIDILIFSKWNSHEDLHCQLRHI